jgi:cytochrome P450 monooxygenase
MESLLHPERAELCWRMRDVLRGLRLRLQWCKYLFLFKHQTWLDAVEVVNNFLNKKIDRTYQELAECEAKGIDPKGARRKDLLWYMATHLRDKELLCSQVSLIFVPNNDTTSIFLGHILWNLARRPEIYAKCVAEVEALGDDELSFEKLRSMKYMNAVLNESESTRSY